MSRRLYPQREWTTSVCRALLCLLLAALSLYNPFWAVHGASHGLRVQHPPSYRGTVAASELGSGAVLPDVPEIVPAQAVLPDIYLSFQTALDVFLQRFDELIPSITHVIGSTLCFRPPPSL